MKGILVNIFGGIMRCDIIADGIVAAAREVDLDVPLVVRLEGTNVAEGKDILAESGLPIVAANDLGDAAQEDRRRGQAACQPVTPRAGVPLPLSGMAVQFAGMTKWSEQ